MKYPPTKNVHILKSFPHLPYHIIAELETQGSSGQSISNLLGNMRKEAKSIGANAIIPTKENIEQTQQGLIFNPWSLDYLQIGDENFPILRGLAIVYDESNYFDGSPTKQSPNKDLYFGTGINVIPIVLSGVGAAGWIKYNNIRFNIEYSKFDVPSSWYTGGFENGVTEAALRIGVDYFFWNNLSRIYLPIGVEFWKNSVEHERYENRVEFDTINLSLGIGYLFNITENVYLDSRFSIGRLIAGKTKVRTSNFVFVPEAESRSAMLGLGFRL